MNKLNFFDIFDSELETKNQTKVKLSKVVIPKIQRDYAQGRKDPDTERIRERFLDALYDAITNKPITLDFIYGDIDEKGILTPLDGQQRLTTLFLLHWYVAKKEKIQKEEYSFLYKFSYETRPTAREFCKYLVDFEPEFITNNLSEEIENQYKFPLNWKKDPTISSMLVMIDAISEKFKEVDNIWEKLKKNAITFNFLAISDMGLTDELYIKMNSRGKPLTKFENFKAELENALKKVDQKLSDRIIGKIDGIWTNLLWTYRNSTNIIDNQFLNYFRFICDIICYKNGSTSLGKDIDEIDIVEELFSSTNENVKVNIEILESFFDCWVEVKKKSSVREFFENYVSNTHESKKIKIKSNIDIFRDCITNFKGYFPFSRIIILYAFITYLLNYDTITDEEFRRRIRVINNLVNNSEDELSIRESRAGSNRIPAMLKQVNSIIIYGNINEDLDINFNSYQLSEEKEKLDWTSRNIEKSENLFELEDNEYLEGQIAIVGLENYQLFNRFIKLFKCNLDKVDCALMTIGNYAQSYRWHRYQLGSKSKKEAWTNLFHKSGNNNFDKTKEILTSLLEKEEEINNEFLDITIKEYLNDCTKNNKYDWRYYYIKYCEFRLGEYGKYWWHNYERKPYEFLVMVTNVNLSENAYQPFLKAIDRNGRISRDDYNNNRIIEDDYYITVTNAAYVFLDKETGKELMKIAIKQDENGIDEEDRILKIKKILYNGDFEIKYEDDNEDNNESDSKEIYDEALEKISHKLNNKFLKVEDSNRAKNLYSSLNNKDAVILCRSKRHSNGYWFKYRIEFYEQIESFEKLYIAYICATSDNIFLIPIDFIESNKEFLDYTANNRKKILSYKN